MDTGYLEWLIRDLLNDTEESPNIEIIGCADTPFSDRTLQLKFRDGSEFQVTIVTKRKPESETEDDE